MPRIHPFLWFDTQAEEAANFYVALFPNSRITNCVRNGDQGQVMTIAFELDGQRVSAINGGPMFQFTEAMSFVVDCADLAEVDRYWDGLLAGGGTPSRCGWLKDRFGFSWQVVPTELPALIGDPDPAKAGRATQAMLGMAKLDIQALRDAHAG